LRREALRLAILEEKLMRRIAFALSLAAIIAASAPLRAAPEQEARKAIQARYDEFNRAYMKKDFKAVADVFDPECMLKTKGEGSRSMKVERMLEDMQAVSQRLTVSNAKTRIVSIKAVGDAYEVSAAWTGESSYVPPKGSKDDPPRSGKTEQTTSDTWKRSEKGWRIVQRVLERDDKD
jgi:hypothetical protein